MNVLLTGAAGFIGSHVARLLIKNKVNVTVILKPTTNPWRIKDILDQVHIISCDLSEIKSVRSKLKTGMDACIHLAWYVEHEKYWTSPKNLEALHSSIGLVNCLMDIQCKHFIGAGSCAEYLIEHSDPLTENNVLKATNFYSAAKISFHSFLDDVGKFYSMRTTWLRFFYLYGPGEDNRRLIPFIIQSLLQNKPALLTSGTQIRDYLYVTDAASAIHEILNSKLLGSINIASGMPQSLALIAQKIGKIMGKEDLIHLGAVRQSVNDSSIMLANVNKLRSIGWNPETDLDRGILNTVDWWKENLSC